jgi:hypothetical protein
MKADNSIASFWHSYTGAEKAAKLLIGKTESLVPVPMADVVRADESPDNALLEVVEYHP